tara:strand:+ start:468 stop:1121 length:654 start_codon:yes stop_codon:yes gene_type:complete
MRSYKELLLSNRAWSEEMRERDENYFTQQTVGQKPEILWIGCSDSRVSPDQITQTNPGEIFIHRNVANIVHPDDTNLMAVLQFAVDVLQVKHIVLCGHHGCGGIEATLKGGAEGPIHEWLEDTRRVYANHKAEVDGAGDMKARIDRLVECNVRDQLLDLAQSKTVKAAFDRGQPLLLHGWVYDIRDGLLKPLMEIDKDTDLNPDKAPDTVLLKEKES